MEVFRFHYEDGFFRRWLHESLSAIRAEDKLATGEEVYSVRKFFEDIKDGEFGGIELSYQQKLYLISLVKGEKFQISANHEITLGLDERHKKITKDKVAKAFERADRFFKYTGRNFVGAGGGISGAVRNFFAERVLDTGTDEEELEKLFREIEDGEALSVFRQAVELSFQAGGRGLDVLLKEEVSARLLGRINGIMHVCQRPKTDLLEEAKRSVVTSAKRSELEPRVEAYLQTGRNLAKELGPVIDAKQNNWRYKYLKESYNDLHSLVTIIDLLWRQSKKDNSLLPLVETLMRDLSATHAWLSEEAKAIDTGSPNTGLLSKHRSQTIRRIYRRLALISLYKVDDSIINMVARRVIDCRGLVDLSYQDTFNLIRQNDSILIDEANTDAYRQAFGEIENLQRTLETELSKFKPQRGQVCQLFTKLTAVFAKFDDEREIIYFQESGAVTAYASRVEALEGAAMTAVGAITAIVVASSVPVAALGIGAAILIGGAAGTVTQAGTTLIVDAARGKEITARHAGETLRESAQNSFMSAFGLGVGRTIGAAANSLETLAVSGEKISRAQGVAIKAGRAAHLSSPGVQQVLTNEFIGASNATVNYQGDFSLDDVVILGFMGAAGARVEGLAGPKKLYDVVLEGSENLIEAQFTLEGGGIDAETVFAAMGGALTEVGGIKGLRHERWLQTFERARIGAKGQTTIPHHDLAMSGFIRASLGQGKFRRPTHPEKMPQGADRATYFARAFLNAIGIDVAQLDHSNAISREQFVTEFGQYFEKNTDGVPRLPESDTFSISSIQIPDASGGSTIHRLLSARYGEGWRPLVVMVGTGEGARPIYLDVNYVKKGQDVDPESLGMHMSDFDYGGSPVPVFPTNHAPSKYTRATLEAVRPQLTEMAKKKTGLRVLVMGIGSGPEVAVLAGELGIKVDAVDINPVAVANTLATAAHLGIDPSLVRVWQSDLFGSVPDRYDAIIFDAPAPRADMDPSQGDVNLHDAGGALWRRMTLEVSDHLTPEGRLFVMGPDDISPYRHPSVASRVLQDFTYINGRLLARRDAKRFLSPFGGYAAFDAQELSVHELRPRSLFPW